MTYTIPKVVIFENVPYTMVKVRVQYKDGNSQKNIYKCIDSDAAMTESKQHCYNIIEKVLCGILTNTWLW